MDTKKLIFLIKGTDDDGQGNFKKKVRCLSCRLPISSKRFKTRQSKFAPRKITFHLTSENYPSLYLRFKLGINPQSLQQSQVQIREKPRADIQGQRARAQESQPIEQLELFDF